MNFKLTRKQLIFLLIFVPVLLLIISFLSLFSENSNPSLFFLLTFICVVVDIMIYFMEERQLIDFDDNKVEYDAKIVSIDFDQEVNTCDITFQFINVDKIITIKNKYEIVDITGETKIAIVNKIKERVASLNINTIKCYVSENNYKKTSINVDEFLKSLNMNYQLEFLVLSIKIDKIKNPI